MTPDDREREARAAVWRAIDDTPWPGDIPIINAALDAYRDAIEARVRWDQQADAEGYDPPGGPR